MTLRRTRLLTGPLALFDLGLGVTATLMPDLYSQLMHGPVPDAGPFMLQRTGVIWLFFSLCEGAAFFRVERWPALVAAVGLLRIMDVPADIVYFATAPSLTTLGTTSLITAPIFNAVAGTLLLLAWKTHSSEDDNGAGPIPGR